MEQLSPKSASRLRRADKLFKSWLKAGTEHWLLVHVEVQGYREPEFPRRMFEYAYRIQDRHHRPVTALVIYTHADRRYHFSDYQYSFFGTTISYHFRTFVLIDHSPETLRQSNNLFALALEVARRNLEVKKNDDPLRLRIKVELVRHLFQQGVPKDKIRQLLDFIEHFIQFENSEFLCKFEEKIQTITKANQPMGIREAILHEVEEKGIEQGVNKKERIFVTRGWEKGLSSQNIADLADMPVAKVEAIIREFE